MRVQHLALAFTVLTAFVGAQNKYKNSEMGVELDTPGRWKEQAYVPDGKGVFCKFRCNRTYASRTQDEYPALQLIEFTAAAQKQPDDADPTRAAYRSYEDYLARNHGGYEILSTEDSEIAKITRRQYKIRDGETLRIATIYKDGDRNVAVEFEVLEAVAERIKTEVNHSFFTFRFIARAAKAAKAPAAAAGREWDSDRSKWKGRTLGERHEIRRELENQAWQDATRAAKGNWKVSEKNDFLLISNVDRRFAQRVLSAAVSFRKICDRVFDPISDEYARRRILRVQESDEEYRISRFRTFDRGFELNDERMIIVKKIDGNSVTELGALYNEILDLYLQDKDVYFHRYMPKWFNLALHDYVNGARPKNRKLEFRRDDYEREALAELKREGKLIPAHELLGLSDDAYDSLVDDDRRIKYQATAMIRYLFGSGKKSKLTRSFFQDFPAAVIAISETHAKNWDDKADIAAMLKEERESYEKALADGDIEPPEPSDEPPKKVDVATKKRLERRRLWQRRRAAISIDVGREAFTFSQRQWKSLDKAYRGSLK